jgi:hypothetical protein
MNTMTDDEKKSIVRKEISTTSGLGVRFTARQVATCLGYSAGLNCAEDVAKKDSERNPKMIAKISTNRGWDIEGSLEIWNWPKKTVGCNRGGRATVGSKSS